MSDIGFFTDADLMRFIAALFAIPAAACWVVVAAGQRESGFQARWNAIAASFAAIASGFLAGSAFM